MILLLGFGKAIYFKAIYINAFILSLFYLEDLVIVWEDKIFHYF